MLESKNWPYMLTYLAVDVPPLDDTSGWTTAELAAWLIMNAVTSGLIQVSRNHTFYTSQLIRSPDHPYTISHFAISINFGTKTNPFVVGTPGNTFRRHAVAPDPRQHKGRRLVRCRSERVQCHTFSDVHALTRLVGILRQTRHGVED